MLGLGVGSTGSGGGGGSTTPGGSSGQLQYNNASAFGGAAGTTFSPSSGTTLTIVGQTNSQNAVTIQSPASGSSGAALFLVSNGAQPMIGQTSGSGTVIASNGVYFANESAAISGTTGAVGFGGDTTTHTPFFNCNNQGPLAFTGGWNNTNVTPVTVNANVTTDQNLQAQTIPAGALNRVGRTLDLWMSGIYSTPAASTTAVGIKVKLGASTLAIWTSTALAGIQATNDQFNIHAKFTVSTAGASSVFQAHGNMVIDLGVGNTVADSVFADVNTGTIAGPDLTASQTLQWTIAFTVASASNSSTGNQSILQTIG